VLGAKFKSKKPGNLLERFNLKGFQFLFSANVSDLKRNLNIIAQSPVEQLLSTDTCSASTKLIKFRCELMESAHGADFSV
jgi:hypothetical protein